MPYQDPAVDAAQRQSQVFQALWERNSQPHARTLGSGLVGLGNSLLSAMLMKDAGDRATSAANASQQRTTDALQEASKAGGGTVSPLVAALMSHPETADVGARIMAAQASQNPAKAGRPIPFGGKLYDPTGEHVLQEAPPPAEPAWKAQLHDPEWMKLHQPRVPAVNPSASPKPERLVEIANPDGSPGTTFVRESDAVGKHGKPAAGPLATASATVGAPPEKQDNAIQAGYGEMYLNAQKAGMESNASLANLHRLDNLLSQIETGRFAGTTQELKKAAKGLGVDLNALGISDNVAAGEAATALSSEMALKLRNPAGGAGMPGALSDRDLTFLQSMTPNLAMTRAGRKQFIQTQEAINKRSQDVARMMRQYVENSPNHAIDPGFFDQLQAFADANPLFAEAAPNQPPPPAETVAQPPPTGANIYDDAAKAAGTPDIPPPPPGARIIN